MLMPSLPFKSRSGNRSHFLLALECYASTFSTCFFFSQLYQINAPSHSYWDSSVWYWRSRIHKKMELKRQTYVTCYSNIKYQWTELYYCIITSDWNTIVFFLVLNIKHIKQGPNIIHHVKYMARNSIIGFIKNLD